MISKDSAERVICLRCSRRAEPLSDPPLCGKCRQLDRRQLRKVAIESPETIREATHRGLKHA